MPDPGLLKLRTDFGTPEAVPAPPATSWRDDIDGIAAEVWRIVNDAQAGGWQEAPTRSALGSIKDYADQIRALLPKADGGPVPVPPPVVVTPPVSDEDWTHLLSGAAGLAGKTKWLAGSTGIDIFVQRGTVVQAPFAGRMTFQRVPGGPMPIGEMILSHMDGRTVRYRHVQTMLSAGAVTQHQPMATVDDASMDTLHWPRGYLTPPDGYQHLDLSLATRPERMNPQGGAGGDVNAFAHVWTAKGGLPGVTVIPHTPGPADGGMGAVREQWLAWGAPRPALEQFNAWERLYPRLHG